MRGPASCGLRVAPTDVAGVIGDGGIAGLPDLAAAPPSARLAMLGSSAEGLSIADVASRRLRFGANEPPRQRERHVALRFAENFTHTLALLLWFAAGLAFAARIEELALAIVAVIAVNGVFAFVQEYRAERVVALLMRTVAVHATVRRDGRLSGVSGSDLVPGDVIRLARGDIVPADCVLLSADTLSLDLSTVTGESIPVERTPEAVAAHGRAPAHDLPCVAPASAVVVTGTAEAVVAATGARSTLGQIAMMVETVEDQPSMLERQVAALSRFTAAAAVLAGTLTLAAAGLSADIEFTAALTFATGVIVALVPEGLLPTLSVSLALGGQRMAERGAAIRRLSAVESVGAVTVVCTDKTGTLTENALSVIGAIGGPTSAGVQTELLSAAALCNDAYRDESGAWAGDPIDVALARWVEALGQNVDALRREQPRTSCTPFEARRRYMIVQCNTPSGMIEIAKGAPEAVLELSGIAAPEEIELDIVAAAGRGERPVMLATRSDGGWHIAGTLRLEDPPRPEAPGAISACHRAGIRVLMLTGDHPGTARAVAAQVGLHADHVTTGAALDAMRDDELIAVMRKDAVFARIDPDQKLRIARLLRQSGEVVVVTGDGVNDAPALQAADVGVAMGLRGTEVAKQAADIVLSDDNFATIVAAIEEGRSIKANIRRFASYVFTSNVAELVPFVLYIFFAVPLPLAVIQVLAIDLGTDLLPALALGAEPPSSRSMASPPEAPTQPLLTRSLLVKTFLFFGLIEATLGIGAFLAFYGAEGWRPIASFDPFEHASSGARALTFLGIVAGQIGCLFAQRDGTLRSRLSLRSNAWIAVGLVSEIAVVLALIYIPGLNRLFQMDSVPVAWILLLPLGAAAFFALDAARRAIGSRVRGSR